MSFARLKLVLLALLACVVVCACDGSADKTTNINSQNLPDKNLKVVIIRHGEKPTEKPSDKSDGGDNLSCQGQNRALQLPAVLIKKIGKVQSACAFKMCFQVGSFRVIVNEGRIVQVISQCLEKDVGAHFPAEHVQQVSTFVVSKPAAENPVEV